jgi:hypothetical protein
MEYRGANFVSSSDARGDHPRNRLTDETLEMLIAWLNAGGNVGIHSKPVQRLFALQSWLSYLDIRF